MRFAARALALALLAVPGLCFAQSGPVAAYGFNEGSGATVIDASGHGNTGTINGAAWTTGGRYGAALSFNGTGDVILIPNSPSLNPSSAITLEAWVRPADQTDWRAIIQKDVFAYYLYASSSNFPLRPGGGGIIGGTASDALSASTLAVDAWSHVAMTYDGTQIRIWVNGIEAGQPKPASGAIESNTNLLRIGGVGGPFPTGKYFQGLIDEVRIYNRALSQAEIQADMNAPVGSPPADSTPPTVPTGLTATPTAVASSLQMNLSWTASTDNVAVTHYRVERCQGTGCTNFVQVGTPNDVSFGDAGLLAATTYRYRVRASDWAGNLSGYSNVASATTLNTPPTGLVAAYGFNEGTGTAVADASGHGNTGTINGAAWTAEGRFGAALSFNGTDNVVLIPSSTSLNLSSAMTLEAWVRPTANQADWRAIVQKDVDAYYLYASGDDPLFPFGGGTIGGVDNGVGSNSAIAVNAWAHVAMTYDGTQIRIWVNGVEAAAPRAKSGAIESNSNLLRIGGIGGSFPEGHYFQGVIDEVRIYDRALSQAEIQADMNALVQPYGGDTTAPTAPSALTATSVSASQINLAWTAATDNVGVTGYRLERCQGASCSTFAEIAQPAGTSFNNTVLSAATSYSYRVRATDAAGNLSGYSNVASATTGGASTAQMYFIHPDHLNTPRLIADQAGNTVWRNDNTEPFGNSVPNGDPNNTGTTFDFPLGYRGQYRDKETGLNQNGFRDYAPDLGRYTRSDPLGLVGGLNTFAYVGSNPLLYVDPWGLASICAGKKPSVFNPSDFPECQYTLVDSGAETTTAVEEKELDSKFRGFTWRDPRPGVAPNLGGLGPRGLGNPPIKPEITVNWYALYLKLIEEITTTTTQSWLKYHLSCDKKGTCGTPPLHWTVDLTFCGNPVSVTSTSEGWREQEKFLGRFAIDWFLP